MNDVLTSQETPRARPRQMVKPLLILLIAAAVVLGGVAGWKMFIGRMMGKFMSAAASAPQTVSTAVAARQSWQPRIEAFGTLRAVRGADLAPQVAGVVDRILFESGAEVRAGQPLLVLKANDDPAKLAQLEAAAQIAAITYDRDREQLKVQAVSQAVVDADRATLESARAQVAAQRALMEEKTVRAPFAGVLGIRQVDVGQYLAAGTAVVTLQSLDPMYVDFYVPQQALARLKVGQPVNASVDTHPGESFAGKLTSINAKVDSASRNVQVRAAFANPGHKLLPGMYATVAIDSGAPVEQITLPQTAITYNPYGDTVYVVEKSGTDEHGKERLTVKQRFVDLGDKRGDQVAITRGITPGETVVTAGQIKLRNGTAVIVDNSVTPANDVNPTPPNE